MFERDRLHHLDGVLALLLLLVIHLFPFDDILLVLKQSGEQLLLDLKEVLGGGFLLKIIGFVLKQDH